jgi:enterochelin esterase-like enzyme
MRISIIAFIVFFIFDNVLVLSQNKKISDTLNAKAHKTGIVEKFAADLLQIPESNRQNEVLKFLNTFPQSPIYESNTEFSLYWFGNAEVITVNGDFQSGWSKPDTLKYISCANNKFFFISYRVPEDARLDYQFCVDSIYGIDPRNPRITPSGYGDHSEIVMPGFIPSYLSQKQEDIPSGTIVDFEFKSLKKQIQSRIGKVYLPPDYTLKANYPTLYVMDGLEALKFMSLQNVLDNLIANKEIEPILVVFLPPGDRSNEYLGKNQNTFLSVLCFDFVPQFEANYAADAKPYRRAISGISAGGHIALLAVLTHPEVFGLGAGQSSSISIDLKKALTKLENGRFQRDRLKIYLDCGRFDLPPGTFGTESFAVTNELFYNDLRISGIPSVFNLVNDGHSWANWRERSDEILRYFFGVGNGRLEE